MDSPSVFSHPFRAEPLPRWRRTRGKKKPREEEARERDEEDEEHDEGEEEEEGGKEEDEAEEERLTPEENNEADVAGACQSTPYFFKSWRIKA